MRGTAAGVAAGRSRKALRASTVAPRGRRLSAETGGRPGAPTVDNDCRAPIYRGPTADRRQRRLSGLYSRIRLACT